MKALLMTVVVAVAVQGQGDWTGKWSGTIEAAGNPPAALYARFRTEGKTVTGSIGSDTTKLPAIANVKAAGDSITFDVTWGDVAHIVLRRQGNELRGELDADGPPPPPGKHASVISITLKRQ